MLRLQDEVHDTRELERGEHLVLFGFRLTAMGRGDCPALHRIFCGLQCGRGDAALGDLLVFVRLIGAAGARRIRLHAPGCCGVSEDERCVLGAIAAAQLSLAGNDEDQLRERMGELLGTAPSEACLMAAQAVGAALMIAGLELPLRGPAPGSANAPTLH